MKKILLMIGVVSLALGLSYGVDFNQWSIENLRSQVEQAPIVSGLIFFGGYVLVTALSLPAAALLTLMGGAVFGLGWGLLLVSFASTVGATLAFLIARTLLRDWVQKRFGSYLETLNQGVEKDGASYLFSLRLIPVVPFVVINAAFALTPIKTWTFYWVSQLGMLAGTAVYVNAGAELGAIESLDAKGVLTPGLIGAFVLLALFPYVVKGGKRWLERRRLLTGYDKPMHFDTNLVVIGGGSAGLVSALIAAAVKAKVTLVERDKMGGDCLNTGCVPSKALLRSAKAAEALQQASKFGLQEVAPEVDFEQVMGRVQSIVATIEPHDSIERFTGLGVECVTGDARIISPWQVQVGDKVINTRNIIIAAGAQPFVPAIKGIDSSGYVTSDTLWQWREQPQKLLVLGGGPIGCELAQAFAKLGTEVTIVTRAQQILPKEDSEVAQLMTEVFTNSGINVLTGVTPQEFKGETGARVALLQHADGTESRLSFDGLLVAVGRRARSEQFSDLDLPLTPQGTLAVDEYLRTPYGNIFACGDIIGPYQFTHMASHQAWYATVNALFGRLKKFKVDYRVVPWATFTTPEVARVGLSEREAQEQNLTVQITRYDLNDLDRAIADGETAGFVKVITKANSDKILGVTIVGHSAGELIAQWVLAMKWGLGLNKILSTVHIYPTLSEANKFTAGEWKKTNAPTWAYPWLEKWHRFTRR